MLNAIEGRYKVDRYCLFEIPKIDIFDRPCTNAQTGILLVLTLAPESATAINGAHVEKEIDTP